MMRLPSWNELIDEQRDVLETPLDQPLFVVGPPGSGKTSLAVSRANGAARAAQNSVIITYNRMLRRLVTLLSSDVHADTMQSYVCRDFSRRVGADPPKYPHDPYALDWTAMLGMLAEHPYGAHQIAHTIIDEGQDLPPHFFEYAGKHISPVLSVFADENQAVDDRGQTTLVQIQQFGRLPQPILLQANHRNTPEIARIAEYFHSGNVPAALVRRQSSGDRPQLIFSSGLDATCAKIATWYKNRGRSIGVVVKWNPTGHSVHANLTGLLRGHRVDIYANQNEDSIDVREPGITVMNVKSVKGQEFDALFVLELESFIPCLTDQARRVMYMICARARDHLMLVYGPRPLTPRAKASLPPEPELERV